MSAYYSAPGSPNVASGSSSYSHTYISDPSSSPSTTRTQPTTRSRTLLFISYRDSIARSAPSRSRRRDYTAHEHEGGDTDTLLFNADDEQQRLMGEEGHVAVDMDATLPPRWCVSRSFFALLAFVLLLLSLLQSSFSSLFLYLALSFRDKRPNRVRKPYPPSRPRVQTEAASKCFVFERCTVFCVLMGYALGRPVLSFGFAGRLSSYAPSSHSDSDAQHQATPSDLPTSLSFLALHFSPPTKKHIPITPSALHLHLQLRLRFYTSTLPRE